ncbi:proline iminopeptidase-family hydrolase [Pseudoxanthomonas winnipegensis]|uniref:Alpha/beta fold hydrolase n=1 Tax=Pseudoxanthomonas winnipegensis TaxID=2480810 RepID=A0A4Q8LB30_9GAMM|nr:proline iminopeptidase-family hydrolase [Pseudoxanthomonas winnipegensis]TAA25715.1 alpha/beta fold hydrolase [Pseudoxanthomonas winnipegensis]
MHPCSVQREGHVPFRGHATWYRVIGDLRSGLAPLVLLHGGPGCTHDYLQAFADLAQGGRAVVFYDQLGNGRSTHLRDAPDAFWTVQLFLDELDALLEHLGIAQHYDLLGQSWGGMLAAEHAVRRPAGLNALVIASSPSSFPLWVREARRLRMGLPQDVREALERHEARGDYQHPDYQAATQVFYQRHVCRLDPWPPEVQRTFAAIADDPTVYFSMNGPTEFHVIGSLRDWDIGDRLDRVQAPTLVISGVHDEATPACVAAYVERIPDARWVCMPESSHMCHVEERAATMRHVDAFLAVHDRAGGGAA